MKDKSFTGRSSLDTRRRNRPVSPAPTRCSLMGEDTNRSSVTSLSAAAAPQLHEEKPRQRSWVHPKQTPTSAHVPSTASDWFCARSPKYTSKNPNTGLHISKFFFLLFVHVEPQYLVQTGLKYFISRLFCWNDVQVIYLFICFFAKTFIFTDRVEDFFYCRDNYIV